MKLLNGKSKTYIEEEINLLYFCFIQRDPSIWDALFCFASSKNVYYSSSRFSRVIILTHKIKIIKRKPYHIKLLQTIDRFDQQIFLLSFQIYFLDVFLFFFCSSDFYCILFYSAILMFIWSPTHFTRKYICIYIYTIKRKKKK